MLCNHIYKTLEAEIHMRYDLFNKHGNLCQFYQNDVHKIWLFICLWKQSKYHQYVLAVMALEGLFVHASADLIKKGAQS